MARAAIINPVATATTTTKVAANDFYLDVTVKRTSESFLHVPTVILLCSSCSPSSPASNTNAINSTWHLCIHPSIHPFILPFITFLHYVLLDSAYLEKLLLHTHTYIHRYFKKEQKYIIISKKNESPLACRNEDGSRKFVKE